MNYGKWKVTSNYVGGEKMYAAYRLKDINEVDILVIENMQVAGLTTERQYKQLLTN